MHLQIMILFDLFVRFKNTFSCFFWLKAIYLLVFSNPPLTNVHISVLYYSHLVNLYVIIYTTDLVYNLKCEFAN